MPDSELTAFTLRLSADLLAAVDHRAAQAGPAWGFVWG